MNTAIQKLPFIEKAGYSIGEIASNIIWMTVMFFLPIFYTDTVGIPAAVVGTMFIIVRLFDALNDPVMGMISDRTNTRWGKYRPYILWMALPYGLGGILMFLTPDLSLTWKIIYAYATYILMMIIYTAIMIPYSALSGVMTSDYLERTSLNSYRFVGAFIGGLFIQGLALMLVNYFGTDNQSVITASIQNQTIIVQEQGSGTAKLKLTATDSIGNTRTDEFLVKVYLPGENPPRVKTPLEDLILAEGFSTREINIDTVFEDIDRDELTYRVETKPDHVIQAEIEGEILILKEKGSGSATVTLTVDDGKGGQAVNSFLVRVQKSANTAPLIQNQLADLIFKEEFNPGRFDLAQTFGLFLQEEIDITNIFIDPDQNSA